MTVMWLYTAQELVLEVLQALTSDTKIVKESIQKGHFFNLICDFNKL